MDLNCPKSLKSSQGQNFEERTTCETESDTS